MSAVELIKDVKDFLLKQNDKSINNVSKINTGLIDCKYQWFKACEFINSLAENT